MTRIYCMDCGACGPDVRCTEYTGAEPAVDAWNRRESNSYNQEEDEEG